MKLEGVKRIVKIEIELEELSKYQKAIKSILDTTKPDGWTNPLGTLREFNERICSIIKDARDF